MVVNIFIYIYLKKFGVKICLKMKLPKSNCIHKEYTQQKQFYITFYLLQYLPICRHIFSFFETLKIYVCADWEGSEGSEHK